MEIEEFFEVLGQSVALTRGMNLLWNMMIKLVCKWALCRFIGYVFR